MQVIAAAGPARPTFRRATAARGLVVAVLLIASGVGIGWLLLGTSILQSLTIATARPTPVQAATSMAAWAFAIVVPAGFVLLGVARGIGVVEHLVAARPSAHLAHLARSLDSDHLVVTGLRLADGRQIPELVLGSFGIAVLAEAPAFAGARRIGNRWEARDRHGRWVGIESPLERTARDGERVRRWLAEHDRDFVVKVHAALVSKDRGIVRSPTCAVVTPEDVAGWLRSLPPQRGLTPARRDAIADLLREAAGA